MYIVIEVETSEMKKFKDISDADMQAILDTEDYIIVRIGIAATPEDPNRLYAEFITEDRGCETIMDGTIKQHDSIVQVL